MDIQLEVRSVEQAIKKKYKDNLVSLLQFGSSLNPDSMFPDSDLDFIVIAKRARKDFSLGSELHEYGCKVKHELNLHIYSKQRFSQELKAGHPVALMGIKFGKAIFDDDFLEKIGKDWSATDLTYRTWYNNGWAVWSRAIMDYFSLDDCCYLKDCHHAARTFLRLCLLKNQNKLAETDVDIINALEKKLKGIYGRIVEWRRNHSYKLNFKNFGKIKGLNSKNSKPLLVTEKIIAQVVSSLENERIYTLDEIIKKISQPYDHISSIYLNKMRKWNF